MKKYLTGCGLAFILSGCGDTPPVDIRSSKIADNGFGAAEAPFLSITATTKSDDLEIREIIVNKGNCQRMNSARAMGQEMTSRLPKTVSLGEGVVQAFDYLCNVIEVEVVTDIGSWTFREGNDFQTWGN
ncbi:hypothetical protein Y5S_02565 [Alcanivorax nanhaiticus]|uniref:Lipoprotein n=1 Tax=Alcanivorax nanhaiticus TaxID=1177154 RepID=A0A095TPD5_9GAMM|nr:hypothetical protein [Alcanivorax nanhaiticus]KGD64263.1 hypothetical protein Y5S_02565 [Alcanivorax nanhaiticus]